MTDQNMILILVIAFFLLGCSFSCNGMKENFASDPNKPIGDACKAYCRDKDGNCDGDCLLCLMKYKDNNLFTAIQNENQTQVLNHLAGKCLRCKREMEEKVNNGDFNYFSTNGNVKANIKNKLKGSCFNISDMLKKR
jgi:hypothetical protein